MDELFELEEDEAAAEEYELRHPYWYCNVCEAQNSIVDGTCQFCECQGESCMKDNCNDPHHYSWREGVE